MLLKLPVIHTESQFSSQFADTKYGQRPLAGAGPDDSQVEKLFEFLCQLRSPPHRDSVGPQHDRCCISGVYTEGDSVCASGGVLENVFPSLFQLGEVLNLLG